uniref:FAR1 domain-containing protein n=1 Tax=Elaeophora elaphi TaxID=1147741 RepID=A0A0R3RP76_9BILA
GAQQVISLFIFFSGGGKRPNQSYLPSGCKAKLRLNSDTTNGYLRISSFHEEHKNHGNTEEDYLLVINKKRRKLVEEMMSSDGKTEEAMLLIKEHTTAPEVTATKNNFALVLSSLGNSALQISSRENSAFVPVTHSIEVKKQRIRQISQQNISPTDSILQQTFTARFFNCLQRIEYLIMN